MLTIVFVLISAALIYLGWIALLYFNQRKMQFMPTHRDAQGKGDAVFKPWRSETGNFIGYLRPVEHPQRAILFLHGNGGEALDRAWIADLASEESFQIFLLEYPGYGARTGAPSERAIYEAAREAVQIIAKQWKIPITVVGESIGTAPACFAATYKNGTGVGPVDRLGLISPLKSATELAAKAYPLAPVRLLHRDPMDALAIAKDLKIPLHVIHGTLDEVVPIEHGRSLLEASLSASKALTEIPGYGHSNINLAIVDSPFADDFRAFIRGE